jgi:MFS family permease
MLLVALPIVVYRLTGSALGMSIAFLVQLAPGVLLAPLAGRLADHLDRRRLMLVVTTLQGLSLLPLLLIHGDSGLAVAYAVIVIQASLATLFDPAKNAVLPSLLPSGDLVSGNSLIALNTGLGRLIGGPLGGLLLAAGDLRTIVVADAASFLIAGLLIARLPSRTPQRGAHAARDHSATAPRARGFSVVLRAREIRSALGVAFIAEIAQGIFVVLFILFVARQLHGGSGEIGVLRGVQAIGAIAAGLALSFAPSSHLAGRLTAIGALAFGVVDLMIWNLPPLTTAAGVYVLLFVLAGAPGVVMEAGLISFLQLTGADHERGRVFGGLTLAENAGQAVGMVAAGVLTAPLGLMGLLNAQGCLYMASGALAAATLARYPVTGRSRRRSAARGTVGPPTAASAGEPQRIGSVMPESAPFAGAVRDSARDWDR